MKDKMIVFYNGNAVTYDHEQEDFGFVRIPEWEIASEAIQKVARKSYSVLEIGAGTGRFTLEIAPLVKQVTAVDIAQNMLDCMTRKMKTQGISNVIPLCGDFMEMDFQEKYDLIVGFSAIEYIKEKEAMFAKVSNLLAPGGHLIVTTPHNTFFRWWGRMGNYFRQGIFMEAYSKKKIRRLLRANGLSIIDLNDLCLKSIFSKGILLFVHAVK
ncbi:MAG TPA: class I SAM-dependent methyltransferase [Firmicutes bacterium]|jgi:predicted TPR repeat methyltransferase|nr:class I SAM-dependent methyltransferase [Bacillota bacterium]